MVSEFVGGKKTEVVGVKKKMDPQLWCEIEFVGAKKWIHFVVVQKVPDWWRLHVIV